ncbi:hypothetical protein [Pseudomonas panipatensis]|uniref:Uncharacterized protein n=1 Tax=Pseudomonas panipatensis TaxID=428992 RepID=A0A1G8ICW2_9PSED|nr:hypothetical protein [Pseudomonas panipatensis]SDI16734.1 hypothetical protein SAMN05216272_106176 [Pseudomonas panipatensis]SMP79284.1 hypothetical protein SAMN06295951_1219 [Pseudomonas panipatensis]
MHNQEVRIEAVEHLGQRLWQVRLGHRGLRFAEECRARAFAAQLHVRRQWLKQQGDGC